MSTDTYKVRDQQPTVLRLHPDLRARLMRDAKAHGRSLTKEIEVILQAAIAELPPHTYPLAPAVPRFLTAAEPLPNGLSDAENSMLSLFRRMPPEKQLALLSLLR